MKIVFLLLISQLAYSFSKEKRDAMAKKVQLSLGDEKTLNRLKLSDPDYNHIIRNHYFGTVELSNKEIVLRLIGDITIEDELVSLSFIKKGSIVSTIDFPDHIFKAKKNKRAFSQNDEVIIKVPLALNRPKYSGVKLNFKNPNKVKRVLHIQHFLMEQDEINCVSSDSMGFEQDQLVLENICVIFNSKKEVESKLWNKSIILKGKSLLAVQNIDSKVEIKNLSIQGGESGWHQGMYFSGALSLYNLKDLKLVNLKIHNSKAEDVINTKHSKVELVNLNIFNGKDDCLDIDASEVKIVNLKITNCGGDGLDFYMSQGDAQNIAISSVKDKGVSIGEESTINIKDIFVNEADIGIAVKDSSVLNLWKNEFKKTREKISIYQKEKFWGIGKVNYK